MEAPPDIPSIAQYLDTVCAWLTLMPHTEREEVRQEVRQHIIFLASAEERSGLSPDEAVAAALDRIGSADTLGKGMYERWLAKVQVTLPSLYPPDLNRRLKRFKFWMVVWTLFNVLPACVLLLVWPSLATWISFLALGSLAGIGTGIGNAWLRMGLTEKKRRSPLSLSADDEPGHGLSRLPQNSSRALQYRYRQDRKLLEFARRTFHRPSNRLYYPNSRTTQCYVVYLVYLLAGMIALDWNVYGHLNLSWAPLKVTAWIAMLFVTTEISAFIVSRFLYRRKQASL